MSKEDWLKAAKKFDQAPPTPLTPEQEETQKRRRAWEQTRHELDRFIYSEEGRAALHLLKAAQREIVFFEEIHKSGRVIRYLDEMGYRSMFIPKGSRYGVSNEASAGLMIDSRKMDEIIGSTGGVMGWLREQLDAIAREAPKP
jgi:hypothetical protein